MKGIKRLTNILQEFSIPLIAGVIAGLIAANIDPKWYKHIVHFPVLGPHAEIFHHKIDFHFLVNDVFMVLFFGVAAKEITESVLPGGALNPMRKAINPLLGTLGGVIGPVGVYFLLAYMFYGGTPLFGVVSKGWGIPTATDIALAWLVARMVFGKGHPAINFLLLLAVADDAIGLVIIAVFYPNPEHPVQPIWLLLTGGGMAVAYLLRTMKVMSWVPYILFGGVISWMGLLKASLHPALALVFIVPFLPGPKQDLGLFEEESTYDDEEEEAKKREEEEKKKKKKGKKGKKGKKSSNHNTKKKEQQAEKAPKSAAPSSPPAHHDAGHHHHSPLEQFEHQLKLPVDLGLFFFAFANAGVGFSTINTVTWMILASLLVGKTLGISILSTVGAAVGFPLPSGMKRRHLIVAGVIAGLGLTVALFVAGEAFPKDSPFQGPAKMGAVFSILAAVVALILGKIFKVTEIDKS
ncbi:MAG: Na+/H+ antiporter NhaA [Myxococcales bacterium]|nr:Na+/H+ antiporter NhaA [Myxococcales bacterium]